MARRPLTEYQVEAIDFGFDGKDHASIARRLEDFAADPHPADAVNPAELLVTAAWHWRYAGDNARSLDCCRRAVADGGSVDPDVRGYLVSGLLHSGLTEEATALARDLMALRSTDGGLYVLVGEAFEEAGDLREATRWFTAGLVRSMRDEDAPAAHAIMLMHGRRRVRQAQGFPPDDYDELSLQSVRNVDDYDSDTEMPNSR